MWSTLAPVGKLLLNDIPNLQTLAISSIFAFLFLLLADIKTGAIKKLKKYNICGRNMPDCLELIKMGNRRTGPFYRFGGILSQEKQVMCV